MNRSFRLQARASILILVGVMASTGISLAIAAEPPTATDRAAAKAGNEIDKAIGPDHPVTEIEMKSGVALSGIKNPAQTLATAEIKNRQGQAIATVSSIDVAPDGTAQAIHADVGGFLGIGTHRVALKAATFLYLKDRNLLVTNLTKEQIQALAPELKPHG